MSNQTSKGITLIFGTAIISGFAIFINSFGVKGFDPYLYTFLKNALVAVFLVGLLLGIKEFSNLKQLKKKDWLLLSVIGLVGGSIPFLLFFKGLSMTAAASGAFIHKTMFIYVAVLAAVFLKERIPNRLFIAGALLLMGNLYFLKFLPVNFQIGDLLVLTAAILWAVEKDGNRFSFYSRVFTSHWWIRRYLYFDRSSLAMGIDLGDCPFWLRNYLVYGLKIY
jgi:drug/metabolite transporter (DMT)-like permease